MANNVYTKYIKTIMLDDISKEEEAFLVKGRKAQERLNKLVDAEQKIRR